MHGKIICIGRDRTKRRWQTKDKKNLKRINQLLKDISRNPFEGIGKHPTVQKPARALIKNGVVSRVVFVKM